MFKIDKFLEKRAISWSKREILLRKANERYKNLQNSGLTDPGTNSKLQKYKSRIYTIKKNNITRDLSDYDSLQPGIIPKTSTFKYLSDMKRKNRVNDIYDL